MTWIDINGFHDTEIINCLGEHFDIDSLVQTDMKTNEQCTKLDVLEADGKGALFLVCQLFHYDPISEKLCIEQIRFYLKENLLITFQETETTLFDKIKYRIYSTIEGDTIRKSKIDYLFYSLLDVIVSHHKTVLNMLTELGPYHKQSYLFTRYYFATRSNYYDIAEGEKYSDNNTTVNKYLFQTPVESRGTT
ncbi:unnamed protein product [Adineta steineri]|nr:unnamed protein product [Adineta steineri]CAF1352413.1 unnamed protein product [Adineta steineri]CAF4034202.1 unnamed protein product [Adineta steineri]